MASVDVYSIAKIAALIPSWTTLAGKPAFIASGETQAEARTAIGAGTSNLDLGSTASTAAAGDHNHDSRYYTKTEVNSALALKAPLTQAVNFQTGITGVQLVDGHHRCATRGRAARARVDVAGMDGRGTGRTGGGRAAAGPLRHPRSDPRRHRRPHGRRSRGRRRMGQTSWRA